MFTDAVLEKIFAHEFIMTFSIGVQQEIVHVFEEILEDRLEENPYVSLSELFVPTATDE